MGNLLQGREQLLQTRVAEQERVAAGDEHIAHLGVLADVLDAPAHLLLAELGLAALGDAAAGAVPAVDGARIQREEQHPVRVLVDDGLLGPGLVLAERIRQLAGADARLGPHGDGLHPHRAERVLGVDERQVVRADADAEQRGGLLDAGALIGGQRHIPLELLEAAHGVALVPAPVAPLGIGGLGEQPAPSLGTRGRTARPGLGRAHRRGRPGWADESITRP